MATKRALFGVCDHKNGTAQWLSRRSIDRLNAATVNRLVIGPREAAFGPVPDPAVFGPSLPQAITGLARYAVYNLVTTLVSVLMTMFTAVFLPMHMLVAVVTMEAMLTVWSVPVDKLILSGIIPAAGDNSTDDGERCRADQEPVELFICIGLGCCNWCRCNCDGSQPGDCYCAYHKSSFQVSWHSFRFGFGLPQIIVRVPP